MFEVGDVIKYHTDPELYLITKVTHYPSQDSRFYNIERLYYSNIPITLTSYSLDDYRLVTSIFREINEV